MNTGQGAIAAATPEAQAAGEKILAEGGIAFDAIVAGAAALAVTEPGNSGLGGEGYCIYYDAHSKDTGALCFMGVPGALATPERLAGRDRVRGPMASMVPGAVAGWFALIEKKCSLPAPALLAPAITLAEEGFAIGWDEAGPLNWMSEQFHASARGIFVRSDRPWRAGDRLRQPELARTLKLIARDGASAFYLGEFAQRLDRFFRETGGSLQKEDLARYSPRWQGTFARPVKDVTIHVPPPQSTGFMMLYGLELLRLLGYEEMPPGGACAVQALVAVLREMDRCVDRFAASMTPYAPEVMPAVEQLFEESSLAAVLERLGQPNGSSSRYHPAHTTSLSACDRAGNLVCLTQTLDHGYGSGVVIPGTGVLMNNALAWANVNPALPRADLVAPGHHNFVPVIPTLALDRAKQPLLALGTPGGNGIPQTTLQVYANYLFHGADLQAAIDRPRLIVGPLLPGEGAQHAVHLEPGFDAEVRQSLPPTEEGGDCFFGNFHAVQPGRASEAKAFRDPRGRNGQLPSTPP